MSESKKARKASIGRRVFGTLIAMAAVYVITVLCDLSALGVISDFNKTIGETYISITETEGNLAESIQQVSLYTNLCYYLQGTEEQDIMITVLKDCIAATDQYTQSLRELTAASGDEELIEPCEA